MTNEEAIKWVDWALMHGRWVNGQVPKHFVCDEKWQAGELAIKALREPKVTLFMENGENLEELKTEFTKLLNDRPAGAWEYTNPTDKANGYGGYCSHCKCDMPSFMEDWKMKYVETAYCPNCGADMRSGVHVEVKHD